MAQGSGYVCDYDNNADEDGDCGNQPEELGTEDASVDSSYTTGPPSFSPVPATGTIGQSQTVALQGTNLVNSDGSAPTVSYCPSPREDMSVTISSASITEVDVTVNVASDATPNLSCLSLETDQGEDSEDYELGYPDASIQVSPSTWPAGQQTPIIITGTNLGNVGNPNVTISPSDITFSVPPTYANGQITATVTVPSTETATSATVTLSPGTSGCTGTCYVSSDPGDPHAQAQATAQIQAPNVCPTGVVLNGITLASLPSIDQPNALTGVGVLTQITVSPQTANYVGSVLKETITPGTNNCPANIQQYTSFSSVTTATSTLFVVGSSPNMWEGQTIPVVQTSFYDSHRNNVNFDVLGATSVNSCVAKAVQTYTCNGTTLGTFTLTKTFTHGTLNGTSVTNVTVGEQ